MSSRDKLAEIRAKLLAQREKQQNAGQGNGVSPVYPHWKIKEDTTAILRFLPDGNQDNPYFWVTKHAFNFPFKGIVGGTNKTVYVQAPCMRMYDPKAQDLVLDEVSPWFNNPETEELAYRYWSKKTFLFQGFVRSDPMEEETPENPIRRFMLKVQIQKIIENGLIDPDLDVWPVDYVNGLDFRVHKIMNSTNQADYTTSSWARKESPLTEEELEAIDKYGLSDLSSFLPEEPSEERQAIIFEMFKASLNDEPYDPAKWGKYYAPAGLRQEGNTTTVSIPNTVEVKTSTIEEKNDTVEVDEAVNTTVETTATVQPEVIDAKERTRMMMQRIKDRNKLDQ